MRDLLDLPRRIAAAVVAADSPEPRVVVDAGSGPGDVLAAFLDEFPGARGIWTDASEEMRGIAAGRLARFGDRVEYRIADMTDLAAGGVPPGVDVITTSRASHHLDPPALAGFYARAAALLRPGGWLVNIDHVGPDDAWDQRLRAARKRLIPARPGPGHHHRYPLPSVRHHLDGYAAAGIGDVEVAWRAFVSCLFMGRSEG
jgi:SAM-dependent methyltransferase